MCLLHCSADARFYCYKAQDNAICHIRSVNRCHDHVSGFRRAAVRKTPAYREGRQSEDTSLIKLKAR